MSARPPPTRRSAADNEARQGAGRLLLLRAAYPIRRDNAIPAVDLHDPIERVQRCERSAISKLDGAVCRVSIGKLLPTAFLPGGFAEYRLCLRRRHTWPDL